MVDAVERRRRRCRSRSRRGRRARGWRPSGRPCCPSPMNAIFMSLSPSRESRAAPRRRAAAWQRRRRGARRRCSCRQFGRRSLSMICGADPFEEVGLLERAMREAVFEVERLADIGAARLEPVDDLERRAHGKGRRAFDDLQAVPGEVGVVLAQEVHHIAAGSRRRRARRCRRAWRAGCLRAGSWRNR